MYSYTYDEIAERYIDTVYRLALARTKTPEHAEDVTQDVFLRLLQSGKKFESEEHLKAWLIRVTINRTKDLFLSAWFRNTEELKENIPMRQEEDQGLYHALLLLPQKYRTVIHLHYYEGYNVTEIAEILKTAPGTVKSRLHRGRALLKDILEKGGELI